MGSEPLPFEGVEPLLVREWLWEGRNRCLAVSDLK